MNKKQALEVLDYFEELFPNAKCELYHETPFQLVIAVLLSAQTTDKKVNEITPKLFAKYPSPELMAQASIEELEDIIRFIGLYRNKAKNIKATAKIIVDKYNGFVPSQQDLLEMLPGVGRKTANVVRSVAFDIPAFAVDTHVARIAKRLGMCLKKDDVLIIEQKLNRLFPKEKWNKAHHQMIFFGRYFCKAQRPSCDKCRLYDICKEPLKKKIRSL